MGAPKGTGRYARNPLQVPVLPEVEERIAKIAKDERVSKASVARDIIEAGLEAREKRSQS